MATTPEGPLGRLEAGKNTAYALFTAGGLNPKADLNCLTIDVASGAITDLLPVKGPAADYFAKIYGESTRIYPFDPKTGQFHFLDILQTGASKSSPITLYSIDPTTGISTTKVVRGASGNVVSFVYSEVGLSSPPPQRFLSVDDPTSPFVHMPLFAIEADGTALP